jgi:hypothetical protein
MLDRHELYSYKQWLGVYMRSKMIRHDEDLLESIDEPLVLLDKLHTYWSDRSQSWSAIMPPYGLNW